MFHIAERYIVYSEKALLDRAQFETHKSAVCPHPFGWSTERLVSGVAGEDHVCECIGSLQTLLLNHILSFLFICIHFSCKVESEQAGETCSSALLKGPGVSAYFRVVRSAKKGLHFLIRFNCPNALLGFAVIRNGSKPTPC